MRFSIEVFPPRSADGLGAHVALVIDAEGKASPTMTAAREAGKYRLEGKDYVFADGDVALFRFNN